MQISVKSNIKEFQRGMNRIQKKQIPFATMNALNDTAFNVRKEIVERTWPQSVRVRSKNFAKTSFRIDKAKKNIKPWVTVYDRLKSPTMSRQAHGERRKPRGRSLAIPNPFTIKRGVSGKVSKAKHPGSLLNKDQYFKTKLRSGSEAIFKRGKRGSPNQLMYVLAKTADVDKSFDFYGAAQRKANRMFDKNFSRRMAQALR